jgi:hypothetical protein
MRERAGGGGGEDYLVDDDLDNLAVLGALLLNVPLEFLVHIFRAHHVPGGESVDIFLQQKFKKFVSKNVCFKQCLPNLFFS